jgi:thioredoxin 2
MAPAFEAAAKTLEPGVVLAKVDVEAAQALAARYGISSIPSLVLFRGGREIARQAGAMNANGIVQWARAALAAG